MITTQTLIAAEEGVWLLGRISDQDGNDAVQSDFSSITVEVFHINEDGSLTPSGSAITIPIVDAIFNTLQTDKKWDTDCEGYNFAWFVSGDFFPDAPSDYRIDVTFDVTGSGSDFVQTWTVPTYVLTSNPNHYGTIIDGNLYFARRLRSDSWELASTQDKLKALYEATQLIDRLNYEGQKTSATQKLEFPRFGRTDIPSDIHNAAYEIAIKLLDGYDPELELEKALVSGRNFGGVSTSYKNINPLPHITSGIVSAKAWRLLYPYVRESKEIIIKRV